MEGVIFKKGTLSGLPKDIWESQKDCETMKNWKVSDVKRNRNYGNGY
jgi:hypothetical protein